MTATLDLPDDLLKRIEELAAARGETVTAFVADALTLAVAEESHHTDGDDFKQGETVEELNDRMANWREEEADFLELMRGPDLDPRSAAEIISEGRNRCG